MGSILPPGIPTGIGCVQRDAAEVSHFVTGCLNPDTNKTARRSKAVAAIYVVLNTYLGAPRAPISTLIYVSQKAQTLGRLRRDIVLVRFVTPFHTPKFLHRPAKNAWANFFPRGRHRPRFITSADRSVAANTSTFAHSLIAKQRVDQRDSACWFLLQAACEDLSATRWFQKH